MQQEDGITTGSSVCSRSMSDSIDSTQQTRRRADDTTWGRGVLHSSVHPLEQTSDRKDRREKRNNSGMLTLETAIQKDLA